MNAPTVDSLAGDLLETATKLEVVTDYVDLPPNCSLPTHTHPGEEFAYILEGSIHLWEQERGESEITAGGTVKVAMGKVHTVRTGPQGAKLVAFRVHEVGKPERTLVDVDAPSD